MVTVGRWRSVRTTVTRSCSTATEATDGSALMIADKYELNGLSSGSRAERRRPSSASDFATALGVAPSWQSSWLTSRAICRALGVAVPRTGSCPAAPASGSPDAALSSSQTHPTAAQDQQIPTTRCATCLARLAQPASTASAFLGARLCATAGARSSWTVGEASGETRPSCTDFLPMSVPFRRRPSCHCGAPVHTAPPARAPHVPPGENSRSISASLLNPARSREDDAADLLLPGWAPDQPLGRPAPSLPLVMRSA